MRVHTMTEPSTGYLVTGCDDVEAAKAAVLAEYSSELADEMGEYVIAGGFLPGDPAAWFDTHPGHVETGRIVPSSPGERDDTGVMWWWRAGYKLGKPGVTTAVMFRAD